MRISSFQHSQMLGWALAGYGIFQGFGAWNLYWTTSLAGRLTGYDGSLSEVAEAALPQFLSALALCLISLFAGMIIRAREVDPKLIGLLFVFGALVSFPVGTLLSAYVLLYLFVIRPGEAEKSEE